MKIFRVTALLVFVVNFAFSQNLFTTYQGPLKSKLTLGLSVGSLFLNTDAVGPGDFGNQVLTPMHLGGMLSYRMTGNLSLRGYWATGQMKADPTRPAIFKRGLERFVTAYVEGGAMLEIDWFSRMKFDAQSQKLSISTLLGGGYLAFFPYQNQKSLRGNPFTVGNVKRKDVRGYSIFTYNILLGGNLKYYLKPQLAIGIESIYRFVGTDFLDGIQAGKANDGYLTTMVTAHYTLAPNISRFNYKLYLKRQYKKHPWR